MEILERSRLEDMLRNPSHFMDELALCRGALAWCSRTSVLEADAVLVRLRDLGYDVVRRPTHAEYMQHIADTDAAIKRSQEAIRRADDALARVAKTVPDPRISPVLEVLRECASDPWLGEDSAIELLQVADAHDPVRR